MEKMQQPSPYSDPLERLRKMDWDYEGDQSASQFSALHFYPGRLISQIPAALIGLLSIPGDSVLDPYCGSGTTVLEAQRLGRPALGIDINPISTLIGKAKTISLEASSIKLLMSEHMRRLLDERLVVDLKHSLHKLEIPNTVQGEKWYHPETLFELSVIWTYIQTCMNESRILLEFCFSSILISACSETRHWGYICDNTRPLENSYANAFSLFEVAVCDLSAAYVERDRRLNVSPQTLPHAKFECNDAALALHRCQDNEFALVVCSPPYFGVIDYVKAQRLTMEWFGLDIQTYRTMETGARSKRTRLKAFEEYIADIKNVFVQVERVVRPGGYCCMILGQSTKRHETMPQLIAALNEIGLPLSMQIVRDVAIRRRQRPHINDESLLIFKKPVLGSNQQ
jgi:DNA modification methylase